MADLHAARKGPSIWPWILGLAALVLAIWLLTELFGDDGAVTVGETTVTFGAQPAYHPLATRAA